MRSFRSLAVLSVLSFSLPVLAEEAPPKAKPTTTADAPKATCEHGVQKALCARCNPKLSAVYKAKGDWCEEHQRPESQCVICNPKLAEKGVK
ncbi:hypothetical protein D7X30_08330 [Corallococcus sp. AB011P]|uniref:hypothetical protein n=1 Tax=Corallococcus sp. AB011P TaxID=2316735 RepID=UPI000EA2F0DA|nr:hypothetical protein [Corallococcus sp. AB011P]RKG60903.1 hypothetical protein D7X30_08330 [Corallococcus sp. AB011P]